MSLVTPTIEVDNAFAEPGGQFTGRVELPGAEGVEPSVGRIREVRVSLQCWTEGRGDKDRWDGPTQTFTVGVDGSLTGYFTIDVPGDAPISYDGSLMRVMWALQAQTDLRLRLDKKSHVSVVIVPVGGFGLYRQPHPLVSR